MFRFTQIVTDWKVVKCIGFALEEAMILQSDLDSPKSRVNNLGMNIE